jgi:hypothetical protein
MNSIVVLLFDKITLSAGDSVTHKIAWLHSYGIYWFAHVNIENSRWDKDSATTARAGHRTGLLC